MIYDENLKFKVIYNRNVYEFQRELQEEYDVIFSAGNKVVDVKFFVDSEGYDAIILYSVQQ